MTSSARIAKHLTVFALGTIFAVNYMALGSHAGGRSLKEKKRDASHTSKSIPRPSSQPAQTTAQAAEAYSKLPLSFEANSGQTDSQVKFMARGSGYTIFLTATEAVLNLRKDLPRAKSAGRHESRRDAPLPSSSSMLRMKLVGANPQAQADGEDQLAARINYFTGRDATKWHTDVVSYAKVRYEGIYPGIDMIYYGSQRQLEYDFVVAPGATPSVIKLAFAGARKARIAENGDLLLRTPAGEIRQHKPVAYQQVDGTRESVAARYVIKDEQIGFQVAHYDTSKPLIIDPILSYSTFLGGAGSYEVAFGVAVDADGNAYITGTTASTDYPVTPGAFQSTIGDSQGDAFVTKLNSSGGGLIYSTYLGGSARDFAWDIAVDADGNAYVTGDTSSSDFPTTAGAFQLAHAAGTEVDGFVVKLDPAGSGLVYSTYLGGSGNEDARAIAVNSSGEAYVTGETPSLDFPTTAGAYRTLTGGIGGNADVFVTKLNATGTALGYSTFLGGSSATGKDIALDSAGNAYIGGVTYFISSLFTFPVTANAHQSAAGAEGFDGFVSELSATGADLLYSSYLGGSMEESVVGVAVDASNNLYVTGYTGSSDFPVTPGCAQAVLTGSAYDTFISKFDLASSPTASLMYSTYLGGSNLEDPHGIAVDSAGNAYVAGYTQSSDYPETESLGGTGFLNAFVAKLNATGSQFLNSLRFGDTYTYGYDLALDSAGNAYVVGQTTSASFATTSGAYQAALAGGGSDAFVTKIDFTATQADLSVTFRPGPEQVTPDSPDIYVMDVLNNGPDQANSVILTDELPAGVSFTSAFPIEGAAGTCAVQGNTVTCELGNLAPNSSAAVAIGVNVTAASGATLVNVASVTSSTADPNTQNNSASFTTEVLALADLSINATVQPERLVNGANITYTVNATNSGPNPALAFAVTGILPSAVTFNNIVNDYGTCTTAPDGNGNLQFDCSLGDTNPGITKTITFAGVANGAPYTQLPLSATVSSTTHDPADYNNNAFTAAQISSPPLPGPTPGGANEAQLAYGKYNPTGQGDIFRRRADAAGLLNLTNDPASYTEFVWSPDGSRIAFGRFNQANFSIRLFVMDADGTNQTQLTNSDTEQASFFVWSPDGTRLAFTDYDLTTSTGTVHTINADGSNRSALTSTGNDALAGWSPDGSRISFTRSFFDPQTQSSTASIYVMNADGSNQIQFIQPAGTIDYTPAWSPDGAQLAWARYPNDAQHGPDLFVAQRDGTNVRNLTNDYSIGFQAPQWSPDGSKLAFLSSANGPNNLSVINADGTGRAVVSGSVDSIYLSNGWSPNGSKLVFSVGYGEVYNGLYIVNADGTGLTHIGDDIEGNMNPAWSPDSSKLAFTSARNGQGSIDIVNADGTNRVDLTNDPASYSSLKWRPMAQGNTPAGTNVTVTANGAAVTFSNVTTAGETTITPIDPNSLTGVPGEYVINANSLAFEIHTTAVYSGPITIGFQVPGVNNPITFSALRVLHGEPPPVPNFVDRTVLAPDTPAPDFATRTIYARVTSLSPFIILERQDAIPPSITITSPTASVYLLNKVLAAGFQCTDAGSGVATCTGPVANGAAFDTASVGVKTFTVNAADVAGNTSQKSVNYTVTYGINPLFDQTKANKSGSTIPIKLELVNAAGVNRSASNIVVTATGVTRLSNNAPGALQDPGNSNPDFDFKFTGGQYHYNLKTTGYATGTYRLDFQVSGDPVTHSVQFQTK